jgi:uncharacterized membrane protein
MMLVLFLGCAAAVPDSDSAAPADSATPVVDTCAEEPTVTWADFGQGFMLGYCQPCHASTAVDRHGAPADVVFDTEADVAARVEAIRLRTLGDTPTMPPGGGVPEGDRELLRIWLECGG